MFNKKNKTDKKNKMFIKKNKDDMFIDELKIIFYFSLFLILFITTFDFLLYLIYSNQYYILNFLIKKDDIIQNNCSYCLTEVNLCNDFCNDYFFNYILSRLGLFTLLNISIIFSCQVFKPVLLKNI